MLAAVNMKSRDRELTRSIDNFSNRSRVRHETLRAEKKGEDLGPIVRGSDISKDTRRICITDL